MRTLRWLMGSTAALLLAGCADLATKPSATAPTSEARQALAPTGKLRVALQLGTPHNVLRDATSGDMKGVAFELGKEMARRLGVGFEPVLYPSVGALLEAGKTGAWDVAFVGYSAARAAEWDFTALHLEIEFGYLVPGGSAIATMGDVDKPAVRVAVQEKSGPDAFFTRTLKNVAMVRTPSNAAALEAVKGGKADVMASIKPVLFEMADRLPGSRVLDDRAGVDPHAMALPKGRGPGLAYARQFVEDAKSEGLVNSAIRSSGMRGATVAAKATTPPR
jgi:polar amino acid transport system substrate-binding protein